MRAVHEERTRGLKERKPHDGRRMAEAEKIIKMLNKEKFNKEDGIEWEVVSHPDNTKE